MLLRRPIDPKELPPQQKLKYIVEVMKMRAQGRENMLKAAQKRSKRALKRAISPKERKYAGLVDDELYGAKYPQMSLLEARVRLCNQ